MIAVRDYDFYNSEIENLKTEVSILHSYIQQLETSLQNQNIYLSRQLEQMNQQNAQLKQQLVIMEQELQKGVLHQKLVYSDQLEHLLDEIHNLTQILRQKSERIVELEYENKQLTFDVEQLQSSREQFTFQNEHFNQQLQFYYKQIEILKQEKNEIHKKYNDAQLQVQQLNVDLQCKSNQLIENAKQLQLQDEIRGEISRAQLQHQEQMIKLLQQEIAELRDQQIIKQPQST